MGFRTVKPTQLGLLFRTVERQKRLYACVSVLAMTEGPPDAPYLRNEPALWKTLTKHAPEFNEPGVVKSQPEYLLFGHAHGYDGQGEGVVGVRFAGATKWLRSFGERHHPDVLQPAPLAATPLHWKHAYGGPGFAANPLGTGRVKGPDGRIALPRFERPDAPWRPGDAPIEPGGFGMLDITHPQRQALVGTYDDAWLKNEFPGMARDADWRFFQLAPQDQRMAADLRGDEAYDFMGLHPTERVQHGRLPGLAPRVFAERAARRGALKEIECKLRTVVFLPDAGAVVQIWQGITPVADEDASELSHLIAGFDALDAPREVSHYAEVFAKRLDDEDGLLAMLRDEDLLPDGLAFEAILPTDIDLNAAPPPDSHRARQAQRHLRQVEAARADVVAAGLDPDKHAPPLPPPREVLPPLSQLGPYLRELDAKAKAQREQAQTSVRDSLAQHAADFAARGESFDHILAEIQVTRTGPPQPRAPGLLDELRAIHTTLGADAPKFAEIGEMLVDERLQQRWHDNDATTQRMYERVAHFQNAAPRTSGRFAQRQRAWIVQRLAAREPLKGFDLTGADLREFDLRGANLDGAMLESACFDGADLSGASALGAVLAHASFVKARADGCRFAGANLGKAVFHGTSLRGADFSRAVLWETDFDSALMHGACLLDAETLYVKLQRADLSHAQLDELLLYQTDLGGTRFAHASVKGTTFLENRLTATVFSGANARGATFIKASGEGLDFDGADLSGVAFVQDPKLPRATLRGATLAKTFAHGTDWSGADFSKATLDGAELGGGKFQGATLRGVHARETGFRFADLRGADIVGADLRGALLANAKLQGARLDATSLYMSDLSRIQIDTATSVAHVNFGKARLYPRWEPPS